MQVDLKGFRVSHPTQYCLRHGYGSDHYRLLQFKLQASHDSTNWVDLDTQSHRSSPIPGNFGTAAFPISGGGSAEQSGLATVGGKHESGWRYFRLTQTGNNNSGNDHLLCAGFEVYGILTGEW